MIRFNKTDITATEESKVLEALRSGQLASDGEFSERLKADFEQRFGRKAIITTSCTDALEMGCLLAGLQPGDEVIVPSYTFSSTALAPYRCGATIVFCDVDIETGMLDADDLHNCLNARTKAIVPIHYSYRPYDDQKIKQVIQNYGDQVKIVEDAAQGFGMSHEGRLCGAMGDFSAFSFHQSKSLCGGELGAFLYDDAYHERAEFLAQKGTDRSKVIAGQKDKYTWVDTGSSFEASNILCALLCGQLEREKELQAKRESVWNAYHHVVQDFKEIIQKYVRVFPTLSDDFESNYHGYWLAFNNTELRQRFLDASLKSGLQSYIGYSDLSTSPFAARSNQVNARACPNSQFLGKTVVRLPVWSMNDDEVHAAKEAFMNALVQLDAASQ